MALIIAAAFGGVILGSILACAILGVLIHWNGERRRRIARAQRQRDYAARMAEIRQRIREGRLG